MWGYNRGLFTRHPGIASVADHLEIERLGGLAGFGGPNARVRSRGHVQVSTLTHDDQRILETLFSNPRVGSPQPDEFRYKLTRRTDKGSQTVEVPESAVPLAVRSAVKDELQ